MKPLIKKFVIVCMTGMLVFSMSACGRNKSTGKQQETKAVTQKKQETKAVVQNQEKKKDSDTKKGTTQKSGSSSNKKTAGNKKLD